MSPSGGRGARFLRGSPVLTLVAATCECGKQYEVSVTALDLARCPNKRCRKPTKDLPEIPEEP
jgi:hypothetical protein